MIARCQRRRAAAGEISKNELVRHLGNSGYSIPAVKNIFSKLDVNEDGKLSQDELREGLIKFAPLRSAPGMGNFNADFVQEIHADADALCATIPHTLSPMVRKHWSHLSSTLNAEDTSLYMKRPV